ncbi:hypothetical protein FJZ19_01090 [Candidatus Pacearchaeota archaeon]|nr:hypothetical protein [Candidatus Pacearchaeota archaeon]
MIRPGDIPIEERINEGQCDISHFFPDNPERDCHLAIMGSPMRGAVYFNLKQPRRATHQSTRRDFEYAPSVETPDYVVNARICLGDRVWNYHTPTQNASEIRRVFILRNQALELDIEESLIWMSCPQGTSRHDEARVQLEQETSDVNNQVILQLMYDRVQKGLPMLEVSSRVPIQEDKSLVSS